MVKKKSIGRRSFKTAEAMDEFLENQDLGEVFKKRGEVQRAQVRKINLDLPEWLIAQLDFEAERAGVSRQPLIKLWLIQKLEEEHKKRSA